DRRVRVLTRRHADRLRCGLGCASCCEDDLTVFAVEAERIRRQFPDVLRESPHAEGACAFLDERGACRVYAARPFVCRTQGLPFRWIGETGEGELVEYRDICPLNETDDPVEEIESADCFTLGDTEDRLRALQMAASNDLRRVRLRDLFATATATAPATATKRRTRRA
ncbi:MAG: YkgJ family cysteine cluster protein, partial [Deltaproteobacteria bacterium]|nr:YkgJ family cysteine cluster protein [Deltaproteobacteria bacterium]